MTYTDLLGNEVKVGDIVLYVTRMGSSITMNTGEVVYIDPLLQQSPTHFVRQSQMMKSDPTSYYVIGRYNKATKAYETDYSKAYVLRVKKLTEDGTPTNAEGRISTLTTVERVVVITGLL